MLNAVFVDPGVDGIVLSALGVYASGFLFGGGFPVTNGVGVGQPFFMISISGDCGWFVVVDFNSLYFKTFEGLLGGGFKVTGERLAIVLFVAYDEN